MSREQDYYDVLKRISQYDNPDKLRSPRNRNWGVEFEEALEMAYENVLEEAKAAIKGKQRPKE